MRLDVWSDDHRSNGLNRRHAENPRGRGADPIDSWRAEATIVCTLRMTLGRVTAAAGLVVMPGMMARAVTRIDATARSMIK